MTGRTDAVYRHHDKRDVADDVIAESHYGTSISGI